MDWKCWRQARRRSTHDKGGLEVNSEKKRQGKAHFATGWTSVAKKVIAGAETDIQYVIKCSREKRTCHLGEKTVPRLQGKK